LKNLLRSTREEEIGRRRRREEKIIQIAEGRKTPVYRGSRGWNKKRKKIVKLGADVEKERGDANGSFR